MYNLPHFKAKDNESIMAFMKHNPFITLCGVNENNMPVATHIPVLFEERDGKVFLLGHVMRKQTHTNAFEHNKNVLAIFTAAHTYVSASNYVQQNTASTWNYQAVHATGILTYTNSEKLLEILIRLTATFENNSNSPSLVEKLDKEYVETNVKAIVGFEIEVTNIEHIFKLSQNRDEQSRNNIIEHLSNSNSTNDNEVAKAMKKYYS